MVFANIRNNCDLPPIVAILNLVNDWSVRPVGRVLNKGGDKMNIRKKTVSITNLGVAVAGALLLSASPVQATSLGEALYLQHCSACHQPNGKGIPGFFPPLADNLRVTSNDSGKIQDYLRRIIFGYHGGLIVDRQMYSGRMPPIGYVGRINDSELLQLINYQRTAWGGNARPITFSELAKARMAGGL